MREEGISRRGGVRGTSLRQLTAVLLMIGVSTIVACWPMIVNRQPFLLSDTMTYIRSADAAVFQSLGVATDWTDVYQERFEQRASAPIHSAAIDDKPVIIAGRSIYYGAFLYVADRLAGLRLAAILQALIAISCLLLTIMRFGRMSAAQAAPYLVAFTILLSFGSSLAFFASYLEPDLTCGLALMAAAHLITPRPYLDQRGRFFWFAVLAFCGLMHASTLLILVVVAAGAFIVGHSSKQVCKRGVALLTASILIGIAAQSVFHGVVLRQLGTPPVTPPFLTARLVADGPGKAYLEEKCPKAGFALCDHLRSLSSYDSSRYSDAFLWSHDISDGVFSASEPAERRRIAAEQARFVIAVVQDRPLAVAKSTIGVVIEQSLKWGLQEFNVAPSQSQEFRDRLPSRIWREQEQTLAFKQAMPVALVEALALPIALLSAALVLVAMWRPTRRNDLRVFCAVLFLGFVADVAICGAVSTPHDRYIMRVAWLIPLASSLTLVAGRPGVFTSLWRRLLGRRVKAWRLGPTLPTLTPSASASHPDELKGQLSTESCRRLPIHSCR